MAVLAPMDRLAAAIDYALIEHGLEDLDIRGIVFMIEREIRVIPIAEHAKALEALALQVDVLNSELVAELANLCRGRGVELLGAEHLLDLMLDGLAMAVPTGHIRRLLALHGVIPHDDVFGDLVHGMADVDRTVRIRRAIVKDEFLVPFVFLLQLLVYMVLVPSCQALGLVLRKPATHGEARLGQLHRVVVLTFLLRHVPSSLQAEHWRGAPPSWAPKKKAPVP